MKWIGKPKEDKKGNSKTGIERKIAEWMSDPDVRYPWEKRKGKTEMQTHEQFLSMAGIMYCSLKENWNKASSDGKRMKETQPKITKVLSTKMPKLQEYRQNTYKQQGYKQGTDKKDAIIK